MENLNAENIINEIQSLIKALKDCGGWVERGNGEGWFNHEILADALALINSQEQRIKELAEGNERLMRDKTALECIVSTARNQARADTVRKMQTIISEKYAVSKVHYVENEEATITYQLTNWDLRVIAKEMLEGAE